MDFKFFKGKENGIVFTNQIVRFNPNNVDFCFQFGDDEPVVFGTGPNQCNITINPTPDGNITFNHNGNVFKLFARERTNG